MELPQGGAARDQIKRTAQVIVVSSVMLTFISYWRTAAVVLCDLASTAYYIGGIVEQSVGPAAPWFILAVMLFSYCVRSVYIESCSLFVRGGVYRVVKEAMGGFLAKLSVSALMFDYILTGPISGVSAGQYLMGLCLDLFTYGMKALGGQADFAVSPDTRTSITNFGSVIVACAATLYFYWENIKGIHESSDKAVKIMKLTTVMAAVILIWCGITLAVKGPANSVPLLPDLRAHMNYDKDVQESPLGFLDHSTFRPAVEKLSEPGAPAMGWFSIIGLLGVCIAFGHSILAMSGEETLAQVYREVESPKMLNFKKAALVVFIYSLVLTAGISFLAVLLIPDDQRMKIYGSNLISGLSMSVVGPLWAKLALQTFVVLIGFLILSGAVNTAIIGSNGVLNRVAEDGVMPDWFLKPHKKYGTTSRILTLVVGLQLLTIVASRGNVIQLGEAYAFGVVWSFVFKALAMVVLRFRDPTPREHKVPLNIKVGKYEVPIGLTLIFLTLLAAAIMNLLTKETATIWGLSFTSVFLLIFTVTEKIHERRLKGEHHAHREQFNQKSTGEISLQGLGIKLPYRKLVAIRSPQNLFMLEKALSETDPRTTAVVVMTAKLDSRGDESMTSPDLDHYDQDLMTAVVTRAEIAGKQVTPLIVPTNNPLYAVLKTAKELQAQELIIGYSNKYTAEEQLDQLSLYWLNLHGGESAPITVRILSRDRDVLLDLSGGNRIPKISERQARTVAELRGAGVGVDRVLMVHDGAQTSSDLFESILTMLDPQVLLDLVCINATANAVTSSLGSNGANGHSNYDPLTHDRDIARQVGRDVHVLPLDGNPAEGLVKLAREGHYDLLVVGMPPGSEYASWATPEATDYLRRHAHCAVCMVAAPLIPTMVSEA